MSANGISSFSFMNFTILWKSTFCQTLLPKSWKRALDSPNYPKILFLHLNINNARSSIHSFVFLFFFVLILAILVSSDGALGDANKENVESSFIDPVSMKGVNHNKRDDFTKKPIKIVLHDNSLIKLILVVFYFPLLIFHHLISLF